MSEHKATIRWTRTSPDFLAGKYSREHVWSFDGGVTVSASPSPSIVPAPYSNAVNVAPEEAFVAAVANCPMLTYLYLASRQGLQIDSYNDEAVGVMAQNAKSPTDKEHLETTLLDRVYEDSDLLVERA